MHALTSKHHTTPHTYTDKLWQTQAGSSEATPSEAGSVVPHPRFEAAASEASTTAFAGFAISCSSNQAPTRQSAAAAADWMSGVSTDLEPCSITTQALSNPEQLQSLISHPPHTLHPGSNPLLSEAVASNPTDTVKTSQVHPSCSPVSPAQTEASTAEPADDTGTSNAHNQAQPVSSQSAALICRRDMSSAALAVQATLAPPLPDATVAALLDTDTQQAQLPAKRQKRVFQHGNYNRYYGYRLGAELEEDPRIQVRDHSECTHFLSQLLMMPDCCILVQTMILLHRTWPSLSKCSCASVYIYISGLPGHWCFLSNEPTDLAVCHVTQCMHWLCADKPS